MKIPTTLIVIAITLSACAQPSPTASQVSPVPVVRSMTAAGIHAAVQHLFRTRFSQADRSHDGFLSLDEAAADNIEEAEFAKFDLNHDRRLSLKEYLKAVEPTLPTIAKGIRWLSGIAQGDMDQNDDKQVTLAEVKAVINKNLPPSDRALVLQQFPKADLNKDGRLTGDEFEDFLAWVLAVCPNFGGLSLPRP